MLDTGFFVDTRESNLIHQGDVSNEKAIRKDADIGGVVAVEQSGIATGTREAGWKSSSVPAGPVHPAESMTLVTNADNA